MIVKIGIAFNRFSLNRFVDKLIAGLGFAKMAQNHFRNEINVLFNNGEDNGQNVLMMRELGYRSMIIFLNGKKYF